MRVGIVAGPYIPIPPPKYGGTEVIINHLVEGLLTAGHQPIIFGPGDSKVSCPLIPIVPKAIYFPKKDSQVEGHNRKLAEINERAESIIRANLSEVDIIHSHGFDLINFQDFPSLTTIHGAVKFEDLAYYWGRKNLYFVSISKNQQEAYPELQYVGVVYNGENTADFPFVKDPEDYVCFLGRLDSEKNPHMAIELAINFGIKIKLGGKVDYQGREYFKEKVEPLLKHPLVEFLGELNFKQKVNLLSKARCNLHPTGFREPFGLSVLEAAYCGTPTLAIARGSMPELIEEEKTGLLVEDFVEGYHLIEKCFEMDRKYISERARLLFNHRLMTEQYLKAYEKVIDIYRTRASQDEVIRAKAKSSSRSLERIWNRQKRLLDSQPTESS